MKQREFAKIAKQLLPNLPGFAVNKNLIFMLPVGDILRGVFFFASVDANRFYLDEFFLPLFVPTDSVHGTYGKRIGNALNWRADNPNLLEDMHKVIRNEAIPFLLNVSTLDGVLNYLKERIESGRPRVNSHLLEALAYTFIKCGDYSFALEALAEQKQRLEGNAIPWVAAQYARTKLIEEKLLQNPEVALQQLEVWKAETIRNLKLEKFC
jgi:hypothetical protein